MTPYLLYPFILTKYELLFVVIQYIFLILDTLNPNYLSTVGLVSRELLNMFQYLKILILILIKQVFH